MTDAVRDPMAVVIHPRDAAAAETAVLAARWLGYLTGAADVVRVEDDVVVRISMLVRGGGRGDDGGCRAGAKVGEEVREGD